MARRMDYGVNSEEAKKRKAELSKMTDGEIGKIFEKYFDGETAFQGTDNRKSMEYDVFWAEAEYGDFEPEFKQDERKH